MKTRYPAIALALLAIGCSQDEASQLAPNGAENPGQSGEAGGAAQALPVWFFGTVHQVPGQDGIWVIRTAGGTQYRPIALPEEFQVEGLNVHVEARKDDAVVTTNAIGQDIEIVKIQKR